MVEPTILIEEAGEEKKEFCVKPGTVLVNESKFMSAKVFDQLVEKMKNYGINISTKAMLGPDLDEMLNKRKSELYKQQQETQKRMSEMSKEAKIEFAPQPLRGCFKCHQEISGKASQCSACKAVIYCSPDCAVSFSILKN